MTDRQRQIIQDAYLDGEAVHEIAERAGVSEFDTETYLRWWCDRGCPGARVDGKDGDDG
jgi:DNA-directed RNA polymerase specialized sigma24 family protein